MTNSLFCVFTILLVSIVSTVVGYSVSGNKIYDSNGAQVILRGVDRPSLEWSATGEQLSLSDYTLMKNWGSKVNVIRVSLNQDTWLSSTAYQTLVSQQVTWVTSNLGLGIILDLHWNNGGQQNMADRKSITFWAQVAAKYKANARVIFELYNEPHDVSWAQWKSGDSTYAGMQELYNAVRGAGSSNVVIVCGLNWAFDLSGVTSNLISGTNIVYGTHPYDYSGKQSGDWAAAFGNLASSYPVIMTEFGQYCNTGSYVNDLLTYAESKGIHWTAWAWYVNGCSFPSIIADWAGTPTTVGAVVKKFLGTSTSTTGSSSTTGTSTPTTKSVYVDALQTTWQDWSWSTSKSFADSTYVHAGSSAIKFAVQKYEAIYFHTTTAFTINSNFKIQFWVNGGTTAQAASSFKVVLYSSSATVGTNVVFPLAVGKATWTLITIPFASFGVSSTLSVDGFAIQTTLAQTTGPYVWVDDVSVTY